MVAGVKNKRCLILGCSRTKNEAPGLLPAIERYDGPPFKVLRRYLEKNPNGDQSLDVYILSAKHGLIDGQLPIDIYDQRMTSKRATCLHDQVMNKVQEELLPRNYDEIFLSMGKVYLQAMDGASDIVGGPTNIERSTSSSGKKLTELRNWLWGEELPPTRLQEPTAVEPNSMPEPAVLRGSTIVLNTDEAIQQLQISIDNDSENAHKVKSWYVDIAGEKISPKWAAQALFQVPVSQYSADEARRVLRKLGLGCYKQ